MQTPAETSSWPFRGRGDPSQGELKGLEVEMIHGFSWFVVDQFGGRATTVQKSVPPRGTSPPGKWRDGRAVCGRPMPVSLIRQGQSSRRRRPAISAASNHRRARWPKSRIVSNWVQRRTARLKGGPFNIQFFVISCPFWRRFSSEVAARWAGTGANTR